MRDAKVLLEAQFDPRVRTYWLLGGALVLVATVVGIVLVPVWFAVGWHVTALYLRRLKCRLTDRTLEVSKGILFRVEKTVPLDKITDLGYAQGPLMRYYGVEMLTVETAGQTSASGGALVKLAGIVEAREFRDAVLRQRDELAAARAARPAADVSDDQEAPRAAVVGELLAEIRDTVGRIERHLTKSDS